MKSMILFAVGLPRFDAFIISSVVGDEKCDIPPHYGSHRDCRFLQENVLDIGGNVFSNVTANSLLSRRVWYLELYDGLRFLSWYLEGR